MTEPVTTPTPDLSNAVAAGILKAVAVLVLVVGLLIAAYLVTTSNDDLKCATRNAERAANGQSTEDCD